MRAKTPGGGNIRINQKDSVLVLGARAFFLMSRKFSELIINPTEGILRVKMRN